jgi:hypothetical protein
MVARDPEQETMITITTRARRVSSVMILKSTFMGGNDTGGGNARGENRAQGLGAVGMECRNNWPLIFRIWREAHDLQVIGNMSSRLGFYLSSKQ